MTQTHFTSTLRVTVDGQALSDDILVLLTEAFVDSNRRLPDMFVLRFRDPDRLVLSRGRIEIGAAIQLTVVAAEESRPVQLLSGEVTALEAEVDGGGVYTTVRGYDLSHRLMNGSSTSSYLNVTYSDIVRKVATEAGISVGTISSTTVVHEFVARTNTSSWDFLLSLADEIGYDVYVEEGKIHFVEPTPKPGAPSGPGRQPHVLRPGADLLRLRAAVTGSGQVSSVQVRSWDEDQQRAMIGTASAPTTGPNSTTTPAILAERLVASTLVVTHQADTNQSVLDATAQAIAATIGGTSAELEGVARGNPTLRAGSTVAIENLGAPFDGTYVLTRARHVLDATSGYTTEVAVTGRQERSMLGLTGGTGGHATSLTSGVFPAVVTNVADPEGLGQVRVKFPWLADTFETDWARVAQPGAGRGYGALVLPEVGDEVVVAFDRGSPERPIVLGGLYSPNRPPGRGDVPNIDQASGKVGRRTLMTPSGSRLDIVDSPQKPGIWLRTGDGKCELGMAGKPTAVTLRSDGTVTVSAKNGITIDAGNGDVTVTGSKIDLRAKTGLTLNAGGGDVQVKGTNLDLAGNVAAKLTGVSVSVTGQGSAELKAPMVRIN
ncbi:VgrG-related protein [Actinopolymorpha pittospori]|uniref:Phage protein D n=1 Tax=Actinopolymorpha pittospori TaxID=648752 RepID=A0A927RPZ6_9ACTN|nr:VgrG-related protein [Actinopolymorpha pittospori]MBE1611688.1 phage protein D [Actinopolymorpha pittospori]